MCLHCRRPGFYPWVGKMPWRRKWQPTPVSLPGKSHGQWSLVGCSPWGCKELGMTERLIFNTAFLLTNILTVKLSGILYLQKQWLFYDPLFSSLTCAGSRFVPAGGAVYKTKWPQGRFCLNMELNREKFLALLVYFLPHISQVSITCHVSYMNFCLLILKSEILQLR